MTKTNRIAGHRLTLTAGVRYIASRPFASRGRTVYPVAIQPMLGSPVDASGVVLDGLTYEQANRLVNSFNNGSMSFDGREWK
jgi:hypothetical protein